MKKLIVSYLIFLVTIIGVASSADIPKDKTIQQEPIENNGNIKGYPNLDQ